MQHSHTWSLSRLVNISHFKTEKTELKRLSQGPTARATELRLDHSFPKAEEDPLLSDLSYNQQMKTG